jgi:hypothetical protein
MNVVLAGEASELNPVSTAVLDLSRGSALQRSTVLASSSHASRFQTRACEPLSPETHLDTFTTVTTVSLHDRCCTSTATLAARPSYRPNPVFFRALTPSSGA